MSAYADALRMLARREHSVAEVRARLLDREHSAEDTEAALHRLIEAGALDDKRVALAYARTASKVKGRGRLRIQQELHAMGIARDVAAEALAETFSDVDERALIDKAIQKKLRGTGSGPTRRLTVQERGRLYQFLMRQGFTPAGISAALRRLGGAAEE
jgi:regulatory protein